MIGWEQANPELPPDAVAEITRLCVLLEPDRVIEAAIYGRPREGTDGGQLWATTVLECAEIMRALNRPEAADAWVALGRYEPEDCQRIAWRVRHATVRA